MPKYISFIQYDGTNFFGFQIQNDKNTISYHINKALFSLPSYKGTLHYGGRTDSKVHSLGNVISYELEKEYKPDLLTIILNSKLPKEIRIYETRKVIDNFNPRFDAIKRIYLYVIYLDHFLPPFLINKVTFINKNKIKEDKININLFSKILEIFKGHHNFNAYTTSSEKRNKWRTIYSIKIKEKKFPLFSKTGYFYFIKISGKSFLHKQIRAIIGCSLYAYSQIKNNKIDENQIIEKIKTSLYTGKKTLDFSFAKPEGLYFKKIIFNKNVFID